MSTYLELCQKVRQEVGVTGTGPTAVTSQTGMLQKIVNWVADADVEIQSRWFDWRFLWKQFSDSTIVGTKDVSAPSDLGTWDEDSFYLDYTASTYRKMAVMDYRSWRDNYRNGTKTNAKPGWIIVRPDDAIILEPPPDAVYTLTADYWKAPTRMSANTSTTPIPTNYERIIVARAKIYYAEHENAPEVLIGATTEYNDLLDKMEAKYLDGQKSRRLARNENLVVRPE